VSAVLSGVASFFRDKSYTGLVAQPKRVDVLPEDNGSAVKLQLLKQEILDSDHPIQPYSNDPCRYCSLKINWHLARQQLIEEHRKVLEKLRGFGSFEFRLSLSEFSE